MMMNLDLEDVRHQRAEEATDETERRAVAALRAELQLAMARAAAAWRDCGVEPGESVAIALASPAETVVACLGVAAAGGVAVLVDPASAPSEVEQLWRAGRWRFILADSREEQVHAIRDFVLTRAEWRQALAGAAPLTGSAATIAA